MVNIACTPINVNKISPEKLTRLCYNSLLVKMSTQYRVSRFFVDQDKKLYFPELEENLNHSECGHEIPRELGYGVAKGKKKNKVPREEKFKVVYKHAKDDRISDSIILAAQEIQLSSAGIISIRRNLNEYLTFKAKVKGSAVYNYELGNKCRKDAEELSKMAKYTYFLTLTYDIAKHGKDRGQAYHIFIQDKQRLMKALKRKYGVEIQCVIEVTDKGYPHAHLVLYSPVPLCGEKEPPSHPQRVTKGKLFRFIQKRVTSRVFDLRKAVPGKIAGYLAKYISKSTSVKDVDMYTKKGNLTKEYRKAVMTAIFPCVFGYRSYSTTFKKSAPTKLKPKDTLDHVIKNICNSFEAKHFKELRGIERVMEAARRAGNLIDFRIKENHLCKGRCSFLKRKAFTPINKAHFGVHKGFAPPMVASGDCIEVKMGCKGCVFMDYIIKNADKIERGMPYLPDFGFFTEGQFIEYGLQVLSQERIRKEELHEEKVAILAEAIRHEKVHKGNNVEFPYQYARGILRNESERHKNYRR